MNIRGFKINIKNQPKYTFDECYFAALSCETKGEFISKFNKLYHFSRNHEWLETISKHFIKPRVSKEKSQFSSLYEWRNNNNDKYKQALKKGLIDEMCKHFGWSEYKKGVREYFHKGECIKKCLEYKTEFKWKTNHKASYSCAIAYGWFNDIIKEYSTPTSTYDKDEWDDNKYIEEGRKFKTQSQWRRESPASFHRLYKKNEKLYELATKHMVKQKQKPSGYWNEKRCFEVVQGYDSFKEFRENESNAYAKAVKKGWVDKITAHMTIKADYTNKKSSLWNSLEEIIKYIDENDIKSVSELYKNKVVAWRAAKENSWLDDIKIYIKNKSNEPNISTSFWDLEIFQKYVEKFDSIEEWENIDKTSYIVACNKGYIIELTKYMTDFKYGLLEEIKLSIKLIEEDLIKYYEKDNKTAKIRFRKEIQNLKRVSQKLRMSVQNN